MRALRTLRTTLVATGVAAALGASATGAFAATAQNAPAAHTSAQSKAQRVALKTVRLADKVSVAKVYKTGKHRYEADVWAKGTKFGTLVSEGKPAYGQNNGLHVTLHPNGTVTSWVERAKPKPQPKPAAKPVLVASATLGDGASKAEVYRIAPNHYVADVSANGTWLDTLVANGRTAYGQNNGLHVVLQPDGQLSSWVG
ncbi:hypothetical protein J2Z21_000345 [Streptomyces griseochromogenes]|uniref:Peptidase M4 n=1 Tax=Streptomyces griseochromogenes TaxID=68214 RepID=A0A1B1B1U9_9ACTN|nr:hypothetical protein [Streptomyces griseochromogenes]ANP52805.1 hypothetical protein AVL59_27600 [Streptomyces griseochromogenes]MBP2047423.1 hypothetical protein [Streptomyces griseochromogenes]